jgi:hypothetical protein
MQSSPQELRPVARGTQHLPAATPLRRGSSSDSPAAAARLSGGGGKRTLLRSVPGLIGLGLLLGACVDTTPVGPDSGNFTPASAPAAVFGHGASACGITLTARLMAGPMHVGNIAVWNDEGQMYLRYQTVNGWRMQVSNGAILGMPQVMPPEPDLFPLRKAHNPLATEHTFVMSVNSDWEPMRAMIQIAAHAVVRHPSIPRQVHAWAEGVRMHPEAPPIINSHRLQDCTREIIAISGANVFHDDAMDELGNQQLVWNSVALLYRGMRTGDKVWLDRGRGSACAADGSCTNDNLEIMRDLITGARHIPSEILKPLHFAIEDKNFAPGEMTAIPRDVRVIFFFTPVGEGAFSSDEIQLLRRFVAEGGRVVYVAGAEEDGGSAASSASQWLEKMGASARSQPLLMSESLAAECASATTRVDRSHGITNDVGQLKLSCAAEIVSLGAKDIPLVWSPGGAYVLGASVRVDTRGTGAVASSQMQMF